MSVMRCCAHKCVIVLSSSEFLNSQLRTRGEQLMGRRRWPLCLKALCGDTIATRPGIHKEGATGADVVLAHVGLTAALVSGRCSGEHVSMRDGKKTHFARWFGQASSFRRQGRPQGLRELRLFAFFAAGARWPGLGEAPQRRGKANLLSLNCGLVLRTV